MGTRDARATGRTARRLLDSLDVEHASVRFAPEETIFAQGDRCTAVMCVERGRVQLTVTLGQGRSAVVADLSAGAIFGEAVLAGRRTSTARALTNSRIAIVKTAEMRRKLHEEWALADWFRSQVLANHVRVEADLVHNTFNHGERRLARVLLLLAQVDDHQAAAYTLPRVSRDLLAEISGMTRSKVDLFMNKFRKLGFLIRNSERNGGLQVHRSMLSVVLQD